MAVSARIPRFQPQSTGIDIFVLYNINLTFIKIYSYEKYSCSPIAD